MNFSVIIIILSFAVSSFAQGYLDINKLIASKYDKPNDIAYIQMHPQYEENQPADKGVVLEFYHGEFDGSEKSKRSLDFIKSVIQDDKRINKNLKVSTLIYGKNIESIDDSHYVKQVQNHLKLEGKTKLEVIPSELNFNYAAIKEEGRSPDAIEIGRMGWTFIRGTAVSGATFASLVMTPGISPLLASSIAIWPGLLSGAITYYNGSFGAFLTNGKWAKWLMESDKWFARKVRSAFNINHASLGKKLAQNPRYFRVKYPDLYKNNPELFEKFIDRKAKTYGKKRLSTLVKKLSMAEEYFKWYITEVMFVGGVIKIPQALGGIGSGAGVLASTGEVFLGSAYGMLAQGPGDIAIQKRKFQKFDELLELAKSNTTKFTPKEKKQIIEEIMKVKDHSISYEIGKTSHKALQKIENWGRSRATMVSFFSVAGVSLEMAGIPAAKPILIGTGVGGAIYYAQVSGWIKFKNLKSVSQRAIKSFTRFLKNPIQITLATITTRMCQGPFIMKQFN